MKRHTLFIIVIALGFKLAASAQSQTGMPYLMEVKDAAIEKMNTVVAVRILFVAKQDVPSRQSVILVPELIDTLTNRSVDLPAIYINGRNQQIYYERNMKDMEPEVMHFRKEKNKDLTIEYFRSVIYKPWMEKSVLRMRTESCKCNISGYRGQSYLCAFSTEKPPVIIELFPTYRVPKAEAVKVRSEKGSAYLCFVVNKTDIRPDYMTNQEELDKINASINLVKNDPNVEIQKMSISGYASPEGKLSHNIKLSQSRTESLKAHIESSGIISGVEIDAKSLGENWSGFRDYLNSNNNIPQREELLSITNENIDEDAKEQKMRQTAKEGFMYCVNNCFPRLRRTDYDISYVVRPFTIEESEEIFNTRPTNLSLNEIYRLADKYKDNDIKYKEIMQKTYALYPDDEAANLTMAYLALKYKDTESAERYLKKVQDCPEKTLNEGIIAYLKGDIEKAKELVNKAADSGLADAKRQQEEFKKLQ